MEVTEALRRRRMSRNFSDRPLASGVVDQLLEGALRAPSAGNTQGRDFVVLEGPEQTASLLGRHHRPGLAGALEPVRGAGPRPGRHPSLRRSRGLCGPVPGAGQGGAATAPRSAWPVPYWLVDTAFATMALLLGATDLGLGAAFLGNFRGEEDLAHRARGPVPPPLAGRRAARRAAPDPTRPSSSAGRPGGPWR